MDEPLNRVTELETQSLFGLNFVSNASIERVVDHIFERTMNPTSEQLLEQCPLVVTPNVDHVVNYEFGDFKSYKCVAENAFIVLPDGMPIVWASRVLRRPLNQRITGADLFPVWWNRHIRTQTSLLAVVANETVAEWIRAEDPKAIVIVPPHFQNDDKTELDRLISGLVHEIDKRSVDFVYLGLNMFKHHAIALELHAKIRPASARRVPTLLLLGASAEFHTNARKRSPKIFRSLGLEWVHRLLIEPRRMFARYAKDGLQFPFVVVHELYRNVRLRTSPPKSKPRGRSD